MSIRKFLNIPNRAQMALIEADKKNIMAKCHVIANSEWEDQKKSQKDHDNVCPKCRSGQQDIVNKIRQVQGKGNVDGSFRLGFGSVSGSMSVDTNEVNHCNKCGNEWKKFKTQYVSDTDIVRVALNYLCDIHTNPNEKTKSWKIETTRVFDGCYAETFQFLINENDSHLYVSTRETLTTKFLRKYYISVFDNVK